MEKHWDLNMYPIIGEYSTEPTPHTYTNMVAYDGDDATNFAAIAFPGDYTSTEIPRIVAITTY